MLENRVAQGNGFAIVVNRLIWQCPREANFSSELAGLDAQHIGDFVGSRWANGDGATRVGVVHHGRGAAAIADLCRIAQDQLTAVIDVSGHAGGHGLIADALHQAFQTLPECDGHPIDFELFVKEIFANAVLVIDVFGVDVDGVERLGCDLGEIRLGVDPCGDFTGRVEDLAIRIQVAAGVHGDGDVVNVFIEAGGGEDQLFVHRFATAETRQLAGKVKQIGAGQGVFAGVFRASGKCRRHIGGRDVGFGHHGQARHRDRLTRLQCLEGDGRYLIQAVAAVFGIDRWGDEGEHQLGHVHAVDAHTFGGNDGAGQVLTDTRTLQDRRVEEVLHGGVFGDDGGGVAFFIKQLTTQHG